MYVFKIVSVKSVWVICEMELCHKSQADREPKWMKLENPFSDTNKGKGKSKCIDLPNILWYFPFSYLHKDQEIVR